MANYTRTSSQETSTSVACNVDTRYYPHLLLLPAAIILTILASLRRRKSFKKHVWGGRPGLVVPIDFLGIDHHRLASMFVFGAATGSIIVLVASLGLQGKNAWERVFFVVGIAIECAFLYYPFFACLTTYHKIIGAMMGLPYCAIFFCLYLTSTFQKCKNNSSFLTKALVLTEMPIIICYVFIMAKFIFVLYWEIKNYGIRGEQFFPGDNKRTSPQVKLVRPWLMEHVKNIFKPKPREYGRVEFYLRKFYNPQKDFKFSTETLSVMMICGISLYSLAIGLIYLLYEKLNNPGKSIFPPWLVSGYLDLNDAERSLLAGVILTTAVCALSLVRFMENHKNNMVKMFKGDKSFIPRNISVSQFMIAIGLRYHSFQIGYFLWGEFLLGP
ncbi:stimulated by retinoic acid gene 6 protein-like [Dendronephthya gigantea]|uniref:stimulated by retinoic acid gene 6 protein-like n=1 Tax=Dendronephthya gigantea TaxID=151771 RepID=UPI0010695E7A|nr:stimulated by retinoic acid gene 6 protein-like [Dendronephthya gigantea]